MVNNKIRRLRLSCLSRLDHDIKYKIFQKLNKGMTNVNCHYGPPGNKGIMPVGIGRKPYKKGDPCTDCHSEKGWCQNGLCELKIT